MSAACSVKVIDPAEDRRWDAFVESHPRGTLYHRSCWKDIIERTFGYMPVYTALEGPGGAFRAVIPLFLVRSRITGNRLVSLPFTDSCNVLAASEDDFHSLLDGIGNRPFFGSCRFLRFCVKEDTVDFAAHGFETERRFKYHVLTVDQPPEVLLKTVVDRTRRSNIRTAERSGVSAALGETEDDLDAFYRLYASTRKKLGLLPMPRRLYTNIWERLVRKGMGHLVLARLQSIPIAGMLFLRDHTTLYAINSGSSEKHLACRPNDLLWWEGIRLASREGLPFFDFGRTAEDNESLRFYKRQWGAVERDIVHYVKPICGPARASAAGFASSDSIRKLVRRMPEPLLKAGGSILYRHFG